MEDSILYAAQIHFSTPMKSKAAKNVKAATRKPKRAVAKKPVIVVKTEICISPCIFVVEAKAAWNGNSYGGGWAYPGLGVVVVSGRTFAEFKKNFKTALCNLIHQMIANEEPVPEWAVAGNFKITYDLL